MPVLKTDILNRTTIASSRDKLYLFGDNEGRCGYGGQAKACRGEPNAVGVATKKSPSMHERGYWSDDDFERCVAIIDADLAPVFEHLRKGGVVVIPEAGLGTGLAELPKRAPRIFAHLQKRLQELESL